MLLLLSCQAGDHMIRIKYLDQFIDLKVNVRARVFQEDSEWHKKIAAGVSDATEDSAAATEGEGTSSDETASSSSADEKKESAAAST